MSHDTATRSFEVGQVPVSVTTMAGLIDTVRRHLLTGREAPGEFVVFRDAHGIVRAQDDERLLRIHRQALLVCPDGRPLVWLGRHFGHRDIAQVSGIESVEALCRAGIGAGWRHYFIGGGEGVAERLAQEMSRRAPGLSVAGFETPPYRQMSASELSAMRARIRDSGAQIVWVGLGSPKQELWMAANAPHLPGTVAMGVGAAFDVNIGRMTRAPRLVQRSGLEWLYRLMLEPRRLWRRYVEVIPRFLLIMLKSWRTGHGHA